MHSNANIFSKSVIYIYQEEGHVSHLSYLPMGGRAGFGNDLPLETVVLYLAHKGGFCVLQERAPCIALGQWGQSSPSLQRDFPIRAVCPSCALVSLECMALCAPEAVGPISHALWKQLVLMMPVCMSRHPAPYIDPAAGCF